MNVSNPKSNNVAYLSVLSQISNCQSLGRKNKHEILKTDRSLIWSLGQPTYPYLSQHLPQSISEITSCFFGPRPWHIEIRHRVKQISTINLLGFETLKLKLWKIMETLKEIMEDSDYKTLKYNHEIWDSQIENSKIEITETDRIHQREVQSEGGAVDGGCIIW